MKRLELCDGVQSWVSRVKRRGLSTHPWVAPHVQYDGAGGFAASPYCLRSSCQEVKQPVAHWGAIHSWSSLCMSCCGIVVLNAVHCAECSMNSILSGGLLRLHRLSSGWAGMQTEMGPGWREEMT